jgi:hypothetical protein
MNVRIPVKCMYNNNFIFWIGNCFDDEVYDPMMIPLFPPVKYNSPTGLSHKIDGLKITNTELLKNNERSVANSIDTQPVIQWLITFSKKYRNT